MSLTPIPDHENNFMIGSMVFKTIFVDLLNAQIYFSRT